MPPSDIAPPRGVEAPPPYSHALDHEEIPCGPCEGRARANESGPLEGYGGIWISGRPFQLNTKCIVIALAVAAVYALPRFSAMGNLFMMAFLFCLTYIAISWYDVLYNCSAHMYSGEYSITGMFKHQYRTGDTQAPPPGRTLAPNQERAYLRSVYFVHTAVITPLVMISAALAMRCQKNIFDKAGVPPKLRSYSIFPVVFGIGALGFLYHSMRLIWPRETAC